MIYIIIFLMSSCIGSFINVVAYSLPRKIDFIQRRSFCPNCLHTLSIFDLIPILSYILLKGKCRYCHQSISFKDTVVEFFCGCIGIICFHVYKVSWLAILLFIFFMILILISLIDIEIMIIYDRCIILCFIIGCFILMNHHDKIIHHLLGLFIISVPMFFCNYLIKDSFGGGDIKLIGVCGFIFGYKSILVAMIIAIMLSGSVALFFIYKKTNDTHIPFAPYITIGVFISAFYGLQIWNWYFSI